MLWAIRRPALAALVLLAALAQPACAPPRDPIVLDEGTVIVENQTSRDWRDVVITVNDHFRGGAPRSCRRTADRAAGPVSDRRSVRGSIAARQSVFKVEVTATDADGKTGEAARGDGTAKASLAGEMP